MRHIANAFYIVKLNMSFQFFFLLKEILAASGRSIAGFNLSLLNLSWFVNHLVSGAP